MEPREAAECPAGPEVPLLPDRGSQQHHQDHQWAHHGADPPEELRQTGGCTTLIPLKGTASQNRKEKLWDIA